MAAFNPTTHDIYYLNLKFETQKDLEEFCDSIGRPDLSVRKKRGKKYVRFADLPGIEQPKKADEQPALEQPQSILTAFEDDAPESY